MEEKERIEFIKELEIKKELQDSEKKKKKLRILFLALLFLIFISFLSYFFFFPKLKLKGKEKITLEYLQAYKEQGYTASLYGKDISKKVKIKGTVNSKKIGTYTLEYIVQNGFLQNKKTRQIQIVDTEKPVLTLKGNQTASVCPEKDYEEEGYEATDNYDGNLTKKVQIKKEKDTIIYSVEDSSHNKTEVRRTLIHQDTEKPVLTLTGSSPFYLYVGQTYQEPGYTAIDNCSGDITASVTVEGSVDTTKAGTYTLTYKARDAAGNEVDIQRRVIVSRRNTGGSTTPGTIYLTFDDGPGNPTSQILDILKEEGVKATFFVTGNGPDSTIARAYREGHTIGLHTYTHNYATVYASVNAYFTDLTNIQNRVKNITGYTATAIRFPGGSSNTISKRYSIGIMSTLTKEVVARGYRYYDWNVDSEDAGKCVGNATCVYNQVISTLSKSRSNMVLMHDIKPYTANALRNIIRYGKNNGYTFLAITESTPMVKHGVNN